MIDLKLLKSYVNSIPDSEFENLKLVLRTHTVNSNGENVSTDVNLSAFCFDESSNSFIFTDENSNSILTSLEN